MKIEDIKFKAKRLDNGEWIIGSFVVMKIPALSKTTIGIVAAGGATLHEVDPSTVCQFTGLKDCEGNEVWNHDLLRSPCREEGSIYEVSWGKEDGGFIVKESVSGGRLLTFLCPVLTLFKFKVIGNKFDKEK
nr:MAG TPA: YopX protein [Caudoviricetes sp.]